MATKVEDRPILEKQGNEFVSFAVVPVASIVGAFVVAALLAVFFLQGKVSSIHGEALAAQAGDFLQFRINQRQARLMEQAESAATSIHLSQLVTQDDPSARSLEEARLRELVPHAIRVRLFPLGSAKRDANASPPFTFTSLDMVNHIETSQPIHPEAINSGGTWVLSLAAPIRAPGDETVRGTLFLYLEMNALAVGLDTITDGQVKLVQAFPGAPANDIIIVGSAGPGAPEVARSLDNPNWQIKYYPAESVANAPIASIVEYLVPLLAFLLVAVAGTYFGIKGILAKVNADAALLANQMADVVSGDYDHTAKYSLHAFVDLDVNLARLGGKRPEDRPQVEKLNVTIKPKETPAKEMVDIEMIDEDDYEREVEQSKTKAASKPAATPDKKGDSIAEIFRAYDIRGVVEKTLTPDTVKKIGRAIGTEANELGERTLIVGMDGRLSSPKIAEALIEGLTSTGCDVINIGVVPTPVLYYATKNSEATSGVMVTASHNPKEYNGFKIVLNGRTLVEEDIQRIYSRFSSGEFNSGDGNVTEIDISQDYMDAITDDVVVAQPLKVVVDCGNGVAGAIAPELLSNLGCDVVSLYCDVDGNFPNHHPDPMEPANLRDLVAMVKSESADLGIAFDGDGDRLVAITAEGEIIWPDRLMMLFAKDVVSRNPGSDVVYDVKCTRHLNSVISSFGGRPIICRSGHSYVKEKVAETGAVLGGEMSGHICFGERWYGFDDGLYSAARLLEIVGSQSEGLAEMLDEFPKSIATPELYIKVEEKDKFRIISTLVANTTFEDGTVTTIDGLRVDFSDGWGLVRASNTSPKLTLRFEADDNDGLERIQTLFREKIQAVESSLDF